MTDAHWKVAFTRHAEEDIKAILLWMADQEGPDRAENLLRQFMQARDSLSQLPERGRIPPELVRVNVLSYREIQAKPYRIVYHVDRISQTVFVHMVADSRRNFTELLKDRLLNALALAHA